MQNGLILLSIIGGLGSTIWGLYLKYKQAMDHIAALEAQAKTKTDMERIAEAAKVSDEKVVDFNTAVDSFNKNNPS